MRLSTGLELAGFALISYAAFGWNQLAGYLVAGISCLVIGYATNDDAAIVTTGRIIHPITARFKARKVRRLTKKAG